MSSYLIVEPSLWKEKKKMNAFIFCKETRERYWPYRKLQTKICVTDESSHICTCNFFYSLQVPLWTCTMTQISRKKSIFKCRLVLWAQTHQLKDPPAMNAPPPPPSLLSQPSLSHALLCPSTHCRREFNNKYQNRFVLNRKKKGQ